MWAGPRTTQRSLDAPVVRPRAAQPFWTPEAASWALAILISAAISGVLAYVIVSAPVPPGGDPGTWISTGVAYLGGNHPSQVIPLAYPPILFPMLGALVLLTGSVITAGQIFAPALYFSLGLSIFYLATKIVRSRLVALTVMGFVMLDPQLLQMIFWGAYPNLLAFVFLFISMAGLVMMGRGRVSRGAAIFWVFGALTVLTHSLAGVVLAGTTFLFLLFTWPMPLPGRAAILAQARSDGIDIPSVVARGLFFSRGGKAGVATFSVVVAAYYIVTFLAHVPHPNYFSSNPLAFRVIGLGGVWHAVFPGVNLPSLLVVDLLVMAALILLFWYAALFLYKPSWLTTPVLVLIATGVTTTVTPVVGWVLRIVTDYTRFGFFLLVPAALSLGYLIDRGWISARYRAVPPAPAPPAGVRESATARWLRGSRHPRRAIALAVSVFVFGLLIGATLTVPSMWRNEGVFTQVGHDQNFLEALHKIEATGKAGAILTVPGADKWARALTDRNTYAPYSQSSFLFYESQVLDSDLSYYALTSHYAVTNGIVTAYVHGVTPTNVIGTPTIGAYTVGNFRPVLSAPPQFMHVTLVGHPNNTAYSLPVTGEPTVTMSASPPSMQLTYDDSASGFKVFIGITLANSSSIVSMTFGAQATSGANEVKSLNVTLIPASYTTAIVLPGATSDDFQWYTQTRYVGPLTFGNSTVGSLMGVTPLDPITSSPAALLSYTPVGGQSASASVSGVLQLSIPAASSLFNVLPPIINTPLVWSELGIKFILMRNPEFAPGPSVAFPGEVQYLETEYNATFLYSNVEWTDLEIP